MKYIWIIMLMLADVAWWVATVRDIKTTLAMNKKTANLWDMCHEKKDIADLWAMCHGKKDIANLWDMFHGKKDIAWTDFEVYTITCVCTHLAALFLISFAKWFSQYVTVG